MTLVEEIATRLSSGINGYAFRAFRFDPHLQKQIAIVPSVGRQIKGIDARLRYTTVQILVMDPDARTAEATLHTVIGLLDSATDVIGTIVSHWTGSMYYWQSENNCHIFSAEFTFISA